MRQGHTRSVIAIGALFWISNVVTLIGSAVTGAIPTHAAGLGALQAHAGQFTLGTLIGHVNDVAIVGYAVLLYPILNRFSPAAALGYAAFKGIEAVLLLGSAAMLLSLAAVTPGDPGAGPADLALKQAFWLARLATFAYLVATPVLNVVLLRAGIVPRPLSILGLAGCVLLVVGLATGVGDPTRGFQVGQLLVIPIILWELVFGGWLIVKGFQPEPALRKTWADQFRAMGRRQSPAAAQSQLDPATTGPQALL